MRIMTQGAHEYTATGGHPTGWLDVPERFLVAAGLPRFNASWRLTAEPSTPILLYRAWYDLLGGYPPYVGQEIGDCVSHGFSRANDVSQCVEIALGEPSTYQETYTEFLYGAARKAGGMLGTQDGCFGSAAAEAMIRGGIVLRKSPYDGRTAKNWGLHGPPQQLEAEAREYKLGAVALVENWPDLVSSLWNGHPVPICSNQGFTMTRDRDGFCKPQGTWNHCMFIAAVRFDRPGAPSVCQSWGPNVPDGPTSLDQPRLFILGGSVGRRTHPGRRAIAWAAMRFAPNSPGALPFTWSRT